MSLVAFVFGLFITVLIILLLAIDTIKRGNSIFFTGTPEDTEHKSKEDNIQRLLSNIEMLLESKDIEYITDKTITVQHTSAEIAFFIPSKNVAILVDDWYAEYILRKETNIGTVITEPRMSIQYNLSKLSKALRLNYNQESSSTTDNSNSENNEALKQVYRQRLKKFHPDSEDGDLEKFIEAKKEYERLK